MAKALVRIKERMTDILAGIPTAPSTATAIAERVLNHVEWASPTMGYCDCPGRKLHSTNDGKRDCVVYLDRVPTIHCMHASCVAEIEKTNRLLRAAVLNPNNEADFVMPGLTSEDKVRLAERRRNERIRLRATKSLPQLLKKYQWTREAMIADSPVNVQGEVKDHWLLLLNKFQPSDVVWIGALQDSGSPECAANFKSVQEWLSYSRAPGQFICPVNFKNTSISRSNANIIDRRFLVVESDVLTKNEVGAVFRWMMECGMTLVAVVDTAGKSLHGWFDYASCESALDSLRLILPAFKCDPKLFTASQPVRLPGAERDGKFQHLVYLAKAPV
jgi:hypothetical protein